MLLEGTANRNAKQLADDISFLGATIEISHSPDYETISFSCLKKYLPRLLSILEEMWEHSVFPEKEWKTMVETATQQNAINQSKTAFQAGKLLRSSLFGSASDYGYSFDSEAIAGLSAQKLKAHFQSLKPVGPALVVVSGMADPQSLSTLQTWLEHFDRVGHFASRNAEALVAPASGVVWQTMPDSQQTTLRIGQFAIDSQHKDSPLFNLTLEIFGGYFGSRLMANIREDKGWTYGIFAQRVGYVAQPYWVIGSDVKGEIIHDALAEIKREADLLRNELVGEEELEKVKNYMLGQFLSSVTNCYGVADRYKSVWINGIDFKRVEANLHTIRNAGAEDVLRIASQYLDLDRSLIALAGNPNT